MLASLFSISKFFLSFSLATWSITTELLAQRNLQHTSGNKKAEEDAKKDAEAQMEGIKSAGSKSGDKVVEELLRVVMEVKPEVPDRIVKPDQA